MLLDSYKARNQKEAEDATVSKLHQYPEYQQKHSRLNQIKTKIYHLSSTHTLT